MSNASSRRPLLRVLLALVDAGRWLAPPSRRQEWRLQWRADVWHQWRQLSRHPRSFGAQARLVRQTAGALHHAFWLRRHVRSLEMITHDLRYGWRLMVRKPGFTAAAVLTLGLGIGANVTMFSWLREALQPLHGVADAERFVALMNTSRTRSDLSLSYPNFVDYRERRSDIIEDLVAYNLAPMNLRTGGEAERVWGQLVTGNYFDVLGVRPPLGRAFRPEEDRTPNVHAVAVFSHNFWQRRFAGDPDVVGRTVTLNGRAFTVVGIAPEGFTGSGGYLDIDLWVPMMMEPVVVGGARLTARNNGWLQAFAKLKPGVSIERAQADFDVIARNLAAAYPENQGRGVKLFEPWRANVATRTLVTVMSVQMALVLIVLLIACTNVAGLMLTRAAGRQRETAVRLALGAGRRRLVQQLLTESTLLALVGGAVGVALAYWTMDLFRGFFPPTPFPITLNPSLNVPVLMFAIALTAASVFVFGLVPALQGSSASVLAALKESAVAVTATPKRTRLRRALVVFQVALSLVLVVSAGLFLQTLRNAQATDPGFSTRTGLLTAIDLLPAGYDESRGRVFFRNLLSRVRELPAVQAASLARRVPLGLGGSSDTSVRVDGYTQRSDEEMTVYWNPVGSDYLGTMGIGLIAGRDFTDRDTAEVPDVGIVNETLVRQYFAGRDPIGGRIHFGARTIQVVGVARDGKYLTITETPRAFLYVPLQQWYRPDTVLHVKTKGDPLAVVPALQEVVRTLDANVPLFEIRTIAEHLGVAVYVQRMAASLIGAFAVLALLLATIGLYGVISAIVVQRTPEIGMRMALGATRRDIIALFLKQGLGLTVVGIGIGLAAALALTRLFGSLLFGVSATDGVSFAATTAVLLVVALAATFIPARRAASVDPMSALRYE